MGEKIEAEHLYSLRTLLIRVVRELAKHRLREVYRGIPRAQETFLRKAIGLTVDEIRRISKEIGPVRNRD
jgi:hypothetical protein